MAIGINQSLCKWMLNFLSNRSQVVKIGNLLSQVISLNVGAAQGCVLSALLFAFYTNDFISHSQFVSFFKYADDITVAGFIKNSVESDVEALVEWYGSNKLILN